MLKLFIDDNSFLWFYSISLLLCQLNPDFFFNLNTLIFQLIPDFCQFKCFYLIPINPDSSYFQYLYFYMSTYIRFFFYFNICHFTLMWDVNLYQIFFYFNTCHITLMWNVNLVQTFVNFIFSIGFYLYLTISPISVHILSFLCKNLA